MKPEKIEELKEMLQKIADIDGWEDSHERQVKEGTTTDDYFCVYDWCGGNFDDAFIGGKDQGAIELARKILHKIKNLEEEE